MSFKVNCVLCGANTSEHVILFKEETLKKCNTALEIRRGHKLKYKEVILPSEITGYNGYHRNCYKTFTALKRKYYETDKSTQPLFSAAAKVSPEPSTSFQIIKFIKTEPPSDENDIKIMEHIIKPEPPSVYNETEIMEHIIIKTEPLSYETDTKNMEQMKTNSSSDETDNKHIEYIKVEPKTEYPDGSISYSADIDDVKMEPVSDQTELLRPISDSPPNKKKVDAIVNLCFFCDKKVLSRNGKCYPLHASERSAFELNINQYLTADKDVTLLQKLKNNTEKTIFYHNICKAGHYNRYKSSVKELCETPWHIHRNHHKKAYEELYTFVENTIVQKGKCYFLSYLHTYYISLLRRIYEENAENLDISFTTQHLEAKLLKTFDKKIKVLKTRSKKVIVPMHTVSIDDELLLHLEHSDIIQKAALLLRNVILKIETKIPDNVPDQQEIFPIPQELEDFYHTVISGNSSADQRQVSSLAHDLIFAVHNEPTPDPVSEPSLST